jgi:hypothetical protein
MAFMEMPFFSADQERPGFAGSPLRLVADTVEELRETSASVFGGWLDGGTAYFASRGLDGAQAPDVTLALIGTLEGAFVLARTLRGTEPLLAAGRVLAPPFRGVALVPRVLPGAVAPNR